MDRPVLLVANHVSGWDGFFLREIHRRAWPGAPLHVVMTEGELRRVPIFRWMGALLHPGGVVAVAALAVESWRHHRQGTVAWKRRTLTYEEVA